MTDSTQLSAQGTNWESAAYEVERFSVEDEVTALEVGAEHIAVQYHVEPHIDVFDRKSRRRIFRLEGVVILFCDIHVDGAFFVFNTYQFFSMALCEIIP